MLTITVMPHRAVLEGDWLRLGRPGDRCGTKVLSSLKGELNFINRCGCSNQSRWRPPLHFEDSMMCRRNRHLPFAIVFVLSMAVFAGLLLLAVVLE